MLGAAKLTSIAALDSNDRHFPPIRGVKSPVIERDGVIFSHASARSMKKPAFRRVPENGVIFHRSYQTIALPPFWRVWKMPLARRFHTISPASGAGKVAHTFGVT